MPGAMIGYSFHRCYAVATYLLNAPYYCNATSIPVAFERVKKPIQYSDLTTKKLKLESEKTKNEMIRGVSQILEVQYQPDQVPHANITNSKQPCLHIHAAFKLEFLGITNKLNSFTLSRKLLIHASRAAYAQLQLLKAAA